MKREAITQKQQDHFTKICKMCSGTGRGLFNPTEPCENCVLPYQVVETPQREVIDIGDDEHSHNVDVLEEDDEAIDEYQHIADYREQEMLSLNQ